MSPQVRMEAWQKKMAKIGVGRLKDDGDRAGVERLAMWTRKENQEGGNNRAQATKQERPLSLLQPVFITVYGSQGCAERHF